MDSWQDFVFLVSNEHELFLSESITNPIKANVHSFGSTLYNCVSYDDVGDNVVKLNLCWTLDVEHFMKGIAKGKSISAVDET